MEVDEENPLLPNLPDDLAILCLLRVPRLLYGLLRCVCRRWRRLLASPTFFDLRVSQNLSQERLCLLLQTESYEYKWFAFDEDMCLCVPLPALPQIGAACAVAVAAGKLYMIGGLQDKRASRSVWAFNPGSNQWEAAAPMKTARKFATAGAIAGQIYVLGGCLPESFKNGAESWAEKYDPLTNQWSNIPSPDMRYVTMLGSVVIHDKLFATAEGTRRCGAGVIFNPLNSTWNHRAGLIKWRGRSAVVNNILFTCNNNIERKLTGYDLDKYKWEREVVEGWKGEVPTKLASAAMVTNVGGKLYMLWTIPQEGQGPRVTKFGLTALNILNQPGMLRGEVILDRVISCNVHVREFRETVSLAL